MISHRNTDSPALRLDRNEHFFTGRRELDGIREEVGDDLHEPIWIRADVDGCGCWIEPHPHVAALGKSAVSFDHLLDERTDLNAPEIQDNFSGLDLLDSDNVVDEPASLWLLVCATATR